MFSLLPFALLVVPAVRAAVYVTNPVQSSQCAAGQPCQVQWIDDGQAPLLPAIGQCSVAVYTGEYQLAQSLPSVNVATSSSFSFTPDSNAGPNGQYYLVFSNPSVGYQGFSGSFTLTGMTGTTPGGGSSGSGPTPTSTTPASSGTTPSPTVSPGITPSNSVGSVVSTVSGTPNPTFTTPIGSGTSTSGTNTFTTPSTTSARTSTSASSTPTGAASRIGSSTSLSGLAALLALSGVLAF